MDHTKAMNSLLAWFEGRLDKGTKRSIDEHLGECNACRAYFEAMSALLKRLDQSNLSRLRPDPLLPAIATRAGTQPRQEERAAQKTGRRLKPLAQAPAGWFLAGSRPSDYRVGVDRTVTHGGQASGYIESRRTEPRGFGTLMQIYKADQYRGKRLRMSAYAKAEQVGGWASLWMRVDCLSGPGKSFDNMQDRPIKGTCDWSEHAIVLDVPDDSTGISFGVLLRGSGRVWVDDFRFEVVTADVPTTGVRSCPTEPRNLGFEE